MNCQELEELFELYALGILEPAETAEIQEHLARNCDVCLANLRKALVLNSAIAALAPAAEPSRAVRKRLMAGVGVQHNPWGWVAAWGALTACLLAGLLYFSLEERQRTGELAAARHELERSSVEAASLRRAMEFLNEPATRHVGFGGETPAPPRGNVFLNPKHGYLMIAANLPPVGAGKTYELWLIPKGGAPLPAGLFQSSQDGTAVYVAAPGTVDPASLGAVAVTVEPEAGSKAPTTPPVIVVAVGGE